MAYELLFLESPEPLFNQCLHFVVDNWEDCLIEKKSCSEKIELKKDLSLPSPICDAILELYLRKNMTLDPKFLKIFENTENIKLSRIHITEDHTTRQINHRLPQMIISLLSCHNLKELHYYSTVRLRENERLECLQLLNEKGKNLKAFSCSTEIFEPDFVSNKDEDRYEFEDWEFILNAPNLEELNLSDFVEESTALFFQKLITPLKKLKQLSIINCRSDQDFLFLNKLTDLTSLTIYKTRICKKGFGTIKKLSQLKFLDISSVSGLIDGFYDSPNLLLASLIESLPNLVSLDISGTNLDEDIKDVLQSRIDNQLEFLGLYKTYNYACWEGGILAKKIAGSANIEQLLNAGYAYFERTEMMRNLLSDLRFINYEIVEPGNTLKFLFKVADRHPTLGAEYEEVFMRILCFANDGDVSTKSKKQMFRVLANMAIRDGFEMDAEFIKYVMYENWFFNMKLLGEFVISLIDRIMDQGSSEANSVFTTIFERVQDNPKYQQILGIKYGVIKAFTAKLRCAKRNVIKGWNLLWWWLTKDNKKNSKYFLKKGIPLFEEKMEHLLDHPSKKGLREMEQILITFVSLAFYSSIWKEYLKYKENFILILIRALNFNYEKKSYVNYYAGLILLIFLQNKWDELSVIERRRDEILKDIRICLEKFSIDHVNYDLEDIFFDKIIYFFAEEENIIRECKYWAVFGISWSFYGTYFEKEMKKLFNELNEDESTPAAIKKAIIDMCKKWKLKI